MDDFGTGWSGLAHPWCFPLGVMRAGRVIAAEGVATEDQRRARAQGGCEEGQRA
jgi:EAL domain-containing protein (putative c-di-GMP-specific phosphodiesterase class I)